MKTMKMKKKYSYKSKHTWNISTNSDDMILKINENEIESIVELPENIIYMIGYKKWKEIKYNYSILSKIPICYLINGYKNKRKIWKD